MSDCCSRCGREESPDFPVERRSSFGIYAGRLCPECAYVAYQDHCGLVIDEQGNITEGGEQGDQSYLVQSGEQIDEQN